MRPAWSLTALDLDGRNTHSLKPDFFGENMIEYTVYDRQADDFLLKHRLSIHAERLAFEPPLWAMDGSPCGERYRVSITRLDDVYAVIDFHYWSSFNDALRNRRPSNYDMLTCVSTSAYVPTNVEAIYAEFGDMPPVQAEIAKEHAQQLQEFFSAAEMFDLAEIV